ncbi:MAG: FCD domain-containing protein [Actinobacteria bacterium]|uniref:Unannotated protein n=1 Tax=freshwater metagenome TaxID=449393 RepID=A0A6J5ZDW1_9ZZZZ|nr:FCD domain-containing protein [Actinomycetota bacterium]
MSAADRSPAQPLELRLDGHLNEDLASSVYRELRAAICDLRLHPNQRLVQNALADELGISRTPVRDALLRLAQEGLVRPAPQRGGYLVSEFTAREIIDIYDVRLALEPDAAAQAATRHGAVAIATLRDINSQIADSSAKRTTSTYELNRDFHSLVIEPSDNAIIGRMLRDLWSMPTALRMYHVQMVDQAVERQMVEEHDAIASALEARDPDATREAVARHIEVAREEAVQQVDQDWN